MKLENLNILLFAAFAFGLPWWAMHSNAFHQPAVHACTGPCYEAWKEENVASWKEELVSWRELQAFWLPAWDRRSSSELAAEGIPWPAP